MTKEELNKLVSKKSGELGHFKMTKADALVYAWNLAIEAAATEARVISDGPGTEEYGMYIRYEFEVDKDSIQRLKI